MESDLGRAMSSSAWEAYVISKALALAGISLALCSSTFADPMLPQEGRRLRFAAFQAKAVQVDMKIVDEDSGLTVAAKRSVKPGTSGIDFLKATVAVEVKEYPGLGVRVLKLCGTAPVRGKYWALFVNGAYSEAGIAGVTFEKDTQIEWKTQK